MRSMIRGATVVSLTAAALIGAGPAAAAGGAGSTVHRAAVPQRAAKLTFLGTTNLGQLAKQNPATTPSAKPLQHALKRPVKSAASASVPVPNPSNTAIITNPSQAPGFVGLGATENGLVNGGDLEPPDQGLCANGGLVLEPLNLVIQTFTESGIAADAPVSLNSFFGLAPAFNPNNGRFGPFLSDPRCYYDVQTGTWFVTTLEIAINPTTGNVGKHSADLIAVSQTDDPTGSYSLFSLDTTDDGTNGTLTEPNCPCFNDQPRIGADAHGFYLSGDSFPIVDAAGGTFNSNGGDLYAISKPELAAAANGGAVPAVEQIHVGAVVVGGSPANAVQPAETPQGAAYPANKEYFLSTPDFTGLATANPPGAQSILQWTLLNTASLASDSPAVTLTDTVVPTEPFAAPPPAAQKPGPHPLGQALGDPVEPINPDDDRMQQVQYLDGHVYGTLDTGVGPNNHAGRDGVAWFDVATDGSSGAIAHQGYLAAAGTNLMYPALALDKAGSGVITFSLASPDFFPSAAFVPFTGRPGRPITITGPGAAPEDGFSCYPQFGYGPPCRWGDYSAAVADGNRLVMADEMISNHYRDELANWSTYISTYKP